MFLFLHIRFYSFFPHICNAIRPFLPPLSVLVTALCVGAPLAINIESVKSPFGAAILLLVVGFHLSAFIAGYILSGVVFHGSPGVKALQRTISFETGTSFLHFNPSSGCSIICYHINFIHPMAGMQSSLLALALANRFFENPLVGVPPAISVSPAPWLDSNYCHICVQCK